MRDPEDPPERIIGMDAWLKNEETKQQATVLEVVRSIPEAPPPEAGEVRHMPPPEVTVTINEKPWWVPGRVWGWILARLVTFNAEDAWRG